MTLVTLPLRILTMFRQSPLDAACCDSRILPRNRGKNRGWVKFEQSAPLARQRVGLGLTLGVPIRGTFNVVLGI